MGKLKSKKDITQLEFESDMKKSSAELNRILAKKNKLSSDFRKFRLQLMGIAGGTLTLFVALHTGNISTFTKLGFGFIGASLLFGTLAILLDLNELEDSLLEKAVIYMFLNKHMKKWYKNKRRLEYAYDKIDDYFHSEFEKTFKELKKLESTEKNSLKSRILKFLNFDVGLAENYQVASFVLGIVLLVVGIFI